VLALLACWWLKQIERQRSQPRIAPIAPNISCV
jgi:hypothetical protein